jgi:predicted RNase H-like HicB family nuclease
MEVSVVADIYGKVAFLDSEIKKIRRDATGFIKIHFLPHKRLLCPLDAVLEPDENGYIARTAEIPLYGAGDTPEKAVDMLKREIESLYDDLQENDQFTEEWLRIKKFLLECIADS